MVNILTILAEKITQIVLVNQELYHRQNTRIVSFTNHFFLMNYWIEL